MEIIFFLILFLVIRQLFDRMSETASRGYGGQQRAYTYGHDRRTEFVTAMLTLIAAVMKADGHVQRSELDYVKQKLVALLGYDSAKQAVLQLRDILKQPNDIYEKSLLLHMSLDYGSKLELLHILYGIAKAKGQPTDAEIKLIRTIATHMGISAPDTEAVINTYDGNTMESVYKILGITPQATDDEVKKAYRSMAMKFHPDKVAGLGKEIEENAATKFRKVQEAYEKIKAARNMK